MPPHTSATASAFGRTIAAPPASLVGAAAATTDTSITMPAEEGNATISMDWAHRRVLWGATLGAAGFVVLLILALLGDRFLRRRPLQKAKKSSSLSAPPEDTHPAVLSSGPAIEMVLMQELASFDFGFGDKDKGHGKVQKAFIRFCRADRRASLPARPNDLDTGLEPSTSESQASTSFQRSDSLAPTGSQKTADTSRSPSFLAIPSLSNRKYGASEADTTRLSPTLTRAASSRKVVGFSALSSSPTTSRNGTSAPSRTSDSTPATGVDELGANDFSDSPEELDLETVLENEQRLGIGTMQRTIGQCLQAYQSEPDLPSVVRKGGLHG